MEKTRGIQRSMIIGLCGFIGSGKNTVAEQLGSSYRSEDGSPLFVSVSFAGVLKDAVAATFGWDRDMLEGVTEEDRKEREKFPSLGTSVYRNGCNEKTFSSRNMGICCRAKVIGIQRKEKCRH